VCAGALCSAVSCPPTRGVVTPCLSNYLSMQRVLGRPTQAYRYLPWLDIGQSYRQVKDYTDRHPGRPCWLLTTGIGIQVLRRPLHYNRLFFSQPNPPRLTGTLLSAAQCLTVYVHAGRAVAPFLHENPRIYWSSALLCTREIRYPSRGQHERMATCCIVPESLDAELQEADEAVTLDPAVRPPYVAMCASLPSRIPGAAISECETAIRLATADPLHKEELSKLSNRQNMPCATLDHRPTNLCRQK